MTRIKIESCNDSDELARRTRHFLGLSRDVAFALGQEAVRICEQGQYVTPTRKTVTIQKSVSRCIAETIDIRPDASLPRSFSEEPCPVLTVSVTNETTFSAAKRVIGAGRTPLALNFASGTSPGGGFLRGSVAQEETLARSSGLYPAIKDSPMYSFHKTQCERGLASEWSILSPAIPVFRGDDGVLLDAPWHLDILTCAAPKANIVGLEYATAVMRERIDRVLAIAQAYGYRSLILGAWGCGAYHNNPYAVAELFRDALTGPYLGAFETVTFAIADWSPDRQTLGPFRDTFRELG